jgi:hypothetical protein
MEESKPLLETEVTARIDLADLIEREQIKTLTSLSNAIEVLENLYPLNTIPTHDHNTSLTHHCTRPRIRSYEAHALLRTRG